MPNWCKNTLTVTGGKKAVAAFVKAAEGYDRQYSGEAEKRALVRLYQGTQPPATFERFCFHALKPVPPDILAKGFDRAGYDWEGKHWGCKWGALDIKVKPCPIARGGKVIYTFKTPNSSPTALLDTVAKDHPTLKLVLTTKYEGDTDKHTTTWNKGERDA